MKIIVWLVSPQHEEPHQRVVALGRWRTIVLELPVAQVGPQPIHQIAQAVLEFWQSSGVSQVLGL